PYLVSGILLVFHITVFVVAANMVLYAVDKRLSLKGTEIDQWVKNARHAFQGAIDTVATGASRETGRVVSPAVPPDESGSQWRR
ncbi:MAG: hypothetical protein ABGX05_07665, partial [Pirellulaceae bacterium]